MRWTLLVLVGLTLILGSTSPAKEGVETSVDIEATKALADKIGTAAEALSDLALLQDYVGRGEAARKTLASFDALLGQLEDLCGELDRAVNALKKTSQGPSGRRTGR